MVKRLLTLCAVALVGVAVMANPEEMQKKRYGSKAAQRTTVSASANVPTAFNKVATPQPQRNAVKPNAQRKPLQMAAKSAAKAPVWAKAPQAVGDTIDIALGDLPFSYSGKTGDAAFGRIFRIIADADTTVWLSLSMGQNPGTYAAIVNTDGGVWLTSNDCGAIEVTMHKDDELVLRLDYNIAVPDFAYTFKAFAGAKLVDPSDPATYTLDSVGVPFAVKGQNVPADPYYYETGYTGIMPLAHIYKFEADDDTTYILRGTRMINIFGSEDLGSVCELTASKGDAFLIAVLSENGVFDFSIEKGHLSLPERSGLACIDVTLPYEGKDLTLNKYSTSWGEYVQLFRFSLTQPDRVLVVSEHKDLFSNVSIWGDDETQYYLNGSMVSTDTLEAGVYYVMVYSYDVVEDYPMVIKAMGADYKDESNYYDLDYSQKLTLDKTVYGKVSFANSRFVQTDDWGGVGQSYSIDLQPGRYSVISTVKANDKNAYLDCGLFVFRNQFDSIIDDDKIAFFGSGDDGQYTNQLDFEVTEAGSYPVLMLSWPTGTPVDFSLVVKVYAPEYYTARTIPYTVKGDFATGSVHSGSAYFNGLSYVYVPQDTVIEISAMASSYNAGDIYVNVGTHDGELDTWNDGYVELWKINAPCVTYVHVDSGYHYIGYEADGYSGQTFDYEYSVSYSDKKPVTENITLPQLLAAATPATLDQPQFIYLGMQPSSCVEGNSNEFGTAGDYYYAIAHKVQLDSGNVLTAQIIDKSNYYTGSLIYKQTADTVEFVDVNLCIADTATTYYVVYRISDSGYKGTLDYAISVAANPTFCTIDTLLAHATALPALEPTTFVLDGNSAAIVDGEDNRFRNSGDKYYAVAYKVAVDSGKIINATYKSDAVDNYWYAYVQVGDTIVAYGWYDGCYSLGMPADTTSTYYLVYTTYYSMESGEITISFSINDPVSMEEVMAKAKPLTAERGQMDFSNPTFIPQDGLYAWVYSAHMDSAQIFNTTYSYYTYRLIDGEWVEYDNYNSYGQLYADSSATYYYVYKYDDADIYYDIFYEFSHLFENIAGETPLVQLPFVLTDSLIRFESVLYSDGTDDLAYASAYAFDLNKDDYVAVFSYNDSYHEAYVSNAETLNPIFAVSTSDPISFDMGQAGDTAEHMLFSFVPYSGYSGQTNIRKVVNYVYPSLDSLVLANENASCSVAPISIAGKMGDMLTDAWFVDDNYDGEVRAARVFKIHATAGDIYTFKLVKEFATEVAIITIEDGVFRRDYSAVEDTRTYTIPKTADYYIVLIVNNKLANVGYWDGHMDEAFQFTILNTTSKIEIKDIVADCDYIQVDEISDLLVKEAVEELTIYAVTTNGQQIIIDNVLKRWSFDADLTEATYAPKLDKTLYKWAANADTTVALFINPAKISASAGEHGEISPSGTKRVRRNSQVTYTITADQGYVISKILVNGDPVSADCLNKREGEYRFKATKNTSIEVEFKSTSAVSETEMINTVVYGRDRMIIVDGAEENSDIRIFTLTGSVIYAGRITSTYEQYNVPASGLYIVRIADKATKVIVK